MPLHASDGVPKGKGEKYESLKSAFIAKARTAVREAGVMQEENLVMIQIFVPRDEMELTFAKSFLEAAGIPYYVHNEYFGGPLGIGPPIENANQRAVMVAPEFEVAAKEALSEYIKQIEDQV